MHVVLVNEEQESNLEQRMHRDELINRPHVCLENRNEVLLAALKLLRLCVARLLQTNKVDGVFVAWYPCSESTWRWGVTCSSYESILMKLISEPMFQLPMKTVTSSVASALGEEKEGQ